MNLSSPDFSSLFYLSPLPIWIFDLASSKILDVNDSAIRHYGYTRDEFLGLTFGELHPKDEISELLKTLTETQAEEGNIYFGVFPHQKKTGERIRMKINGHRVDFLDRKCVMAVCQDVTEEEKQVLMIRESDERLKAASAISKLGYWRWDLDGNALVTWSEEIYRIWGRERASFPLSYENLLGTIHPDDRQSFEQEKNAALSGEKTLDITHRICLPDGSIKWVRQLGRLIRDLSGQHDVFEGTAQDITAQKQEEQRLKLLESVITNTKDAILITEAEPVGEPGPVIIYVNEAFTQMTGYTSEEVIGKNPRILQGPNSSREELAKLSKALRNWESCEVTTINYKKNGEEFWINFTVSPVSNEKGWFTHWIAIERDVTAQKQSELEKELLGKISQNFKFENGLRVCIEKVCQTVSEFGKFDFAELWLPNIENSQIQLISANSTTSHAETFYQESRDIKSFQLGEGLPGIVWQKKSAVLWSDAAENDDFVRKESADKTGIKSVLGIPMFFDQKVVGVLVAGTTREVNYLKKYIGLFEQLEEFIGSEINRKKLENDLSHLYDAIPDMICLADFQGRFLKMNKAGCELLGYREEEILFQTFEKFIHPDDLTVYRRELMGLGLGQTLFEFQARFITKVGEVIWLSWTCSSELEEGLFYASAKNVSKEKKLSQLHVQASSLARIGSWEIDLVGQQMYWSDLVHQLHETDPETFVPDLKTGINFYREDFRDFVTQEVRKSIASGIPFDLEAVIVTTSKKERWIRAIGNAEMIDGQCTKIYGSFQDISSLKESEIKLLSLSDNLPGILCEYHILTDGSESMQYVSRGVKQLWGFTVNEVMRDLRPVWCRIKAGGDYAKVVESARRSIQTKSKLTIRYRYVMPTGEHRTHLVNGTPIFLSDGTIIFNTIVLDITQETKNEELLAQTGKMARIGSWESDLITTNRGAVYWSPMLREILEVGDSYNATRIPGLEFYTEESKDRIQHAVETLIHEGLEFDLELLLLTGKGHERWVRCIGKSETANKKRTKIYGSFQDIHGGKIAALELEKSLKELKDYKFTLDQSAIIAFTDNRGVITSVNDNFCKISGYNQAELIGKTHKLINSKHHPKEFFSDLWKTIAAGKVWRGEIKNRAKDGYYYWVYTTIVPFLDESNKPFQYLAIRFDISDRKKAEEAVLNALVEKNSILERITEAFVSLDANWCYTYMNKKAGEIFNRDPETVIGKHIWTEFPEGRNLPFHLAYEKAMATQQYTHVEEHYPPYDLWFENHIYPSPDGLSIFFRDISERKRSEESLRKSNERFEKVTEATNDAIWDWDLENQTFYRSNGIEKIFGRHASKTLGESDFWMDNFHAEDLHTIRQSINNAIEDPEVTRWEMEYRIQKENGEVGYVVDKGVIIRNKKGKALRMVGAMTDISERKRHEAELVKLNESLKKHAHELELTNEQLEQFAFIASHDLQEPLRMISSFLDQLKRKYGDQLDDKAHQYINFSVDGAKRMKQIILDLLEYSRAGKFEKSRSKINLDQLLYEYKSLRKKMIEERSVELIHPPLLVVEGYWAPFTQVVHCLLDNAIKYSREGVSPRVELGVVETDIEWVFSVRDNGIGINPEFFEKIFVIFQRLHNREKYEGSGIGLSIVKKQVESWGGKVWLESTPGEGSVFYFTLPK